MTEPHNEEKYKQLKKAFDDIAKTIFNYETRSLPTDPDEKIRRIEQYKEELVTTYNNLVSYASSVYDSVDVKSKNILKEAIAKRKLKILRALLVLGLTTDLPERFENIDLNNLVDKDALAHGTDNSQIFVNLPKNTESGSTNNAKQANTSQSVESTPASSRKSSLESENLTENRNKESPTLTSDLNRSRESIDFEPQQANEGGSDLPTDEGNTTSKMTLPLTDILNGIPDFSCKTHDEIKHFIAKADLIHDLAKDQNATVLSVIRTKLCTASKLGNISASTWSEIKKAISEKYRVSMSFETAQERLLSIKQGQKESLDDYANRVKVLLDALNSASSNTNADVQAANHVNNESLAVRKFKQNIFDEKIRLMALSSEHTSLTEAIAHAAEKREQLQSSNVSRDLSKNESKNGQNNKNGNGNGNTNNSGSNRKSNGGKREPCAHCKKTNHETGRCFFRPRGESASSSNGKGDMKAEKFTNRARSNKNMNVAMGTEEEEDECDAPPNLVSAQSQSVQLQPYRYLNC